MRDTATKQQVRDVGPGPVPRPPRGRHRKPRPRRALFAVGGLALAAGALTLLRPAAGPPGGGVTAADSDPTAADFTATADPAAVADSEAAAVSGAPTARTSRSPTTASSGDDAAAPPPDAGRPPAAPKPSGAAPNRPTTGSATTADGPRPPATEPGP
ncbi:hypothetical protein FE633_38160, partial [Streptomyces montanus]